MKTFLHQNSVGTHIKHDGRFICQTVGNLFRCYCGKKL